MDLAAAVERAAGSAVLGLEPLGGGTAAEFSAASPALVHGDPRGGNVLVRDGRIAAFIDPAIHHADPEVELAFSMLFGARRASREPQPKDCRNRLVGGELPAGRHLTPRVRSRPAISRSGSAISARPADICVFMGAGCRAALAAVRPALQIPAFSAGGE